MLDALRRKDVKVRILLAVIVGVIAVGMLLYLVPGQGSADRVSGDVLAEVGGREITALQIRADLQRLEQGRTLPPALRPLYTKQLLEGLVAQHALDYEASRLGIRVTEEEAAARIQLLLRDVFPGGSFAGMERYRTEVQTRFQMTVAEFEQRIREGLLEEKLRRLVTEGISISAAEIQEEFRRRNEKVALEYVLFKPEDLTSKISASDAELSAYFEKHKDRYGVPEKRVVRYALLDLNGLRQRVGVADGEIRSYYNDHVERYRVPHRVHVRHILFKTVGKTDAEIEEIRRKAQDVLKKARGQGKFDELAKQYSEDAANKDKGGDLGWILEGQTVPEFERVAFTLAKGTISDLVKTQYGFHIIKIMDRESARTKGVDEVRAEIVVVLKGEKADREAARISDQIASAIRQSNRRPLDDLAKQFGMGIHETRPVAATDTIIELGTGPEIREAIFRLRPGDLSAPIRTERGDLVLSIKEVIPAHPGTLAEVRDKVLEDYRQEKGSELAKARAEELSRRAQAGQAFAALAKSLGVEAKKSDPFPRTGSVPGVGSGRQFLAAFRMSVGQTSEPVPFGNHWLVYRVVAKEEPKPEDLDRQRKEIEQQVLQAKRAAAYDAFRAGLEERLRQEGKLKLFPEAIQRASRPI